MATPAQRHHLYHLMEYLLTKERQVHYPWHDIRTSFDAHTFRLSESQMTALLNHGGSIQFDCSQSAQQLCRWAGLKDPCGLGYRYAGWTGNMLAHLRHYYEPSAALTGALVVYGPGGGHHVSMVMEPGKNPLLWSHGREAGPLTVRLSDQKQQQPSPVTFLSIANL